MNEGRRGVVITAMDLAEAGDVDRAVDLIMDRVRAEEAIIERLLGLPGGSVDLAGSPEVIRQMMRLWNGAP
jgi:hypothetical protein